METAPEDGGRHMETHSLTFTQALIIPFALLLLLLCDNASSGRLWEFRPQQAKLPRLLVNSTQIHESSYKLFLFRDFESLLGNTVTTIQSRFLLLNEKTFMKRDFLVFLCRSMYLSFS